MNVKAKFACATFLTSAVLAAPAAWAQDSTARDSSGFFISGSYGGYKSHGGEFEDENDLLGASVGYQFNKFFALEADYIDFGNFGEDDVEGKLKGVGLGLIGRLPLTDSFGVYAKAGAFASAFDVEAFDEDETYDEVNPFVGAGVDFRVTQHLTAFAEYDRYNVDIDEDDFNGQVTNDGPDFDTGRVGLRFQF
ncbi:porin family protein [Marinobacter lipolyticus]|uniref:outer membrane protein n=1 Tax=Marinobacter lipolyticus TaxID=209639 RepID=UPI001BD185A3|nr:outer membrane beta-barrel protein [Marinobacter lipolyticus]MBS8240504.1 porin family protein [Marinobacter lipolyticus]